MKVFPKVEYLLLDYVAESPYEICNLMQRDFFFDKLYHNLQTYQLIEILTRLFAEEILIAFPSFSFDSEDPFESKFAPTRNEIEKTLGDSTDSYDFMYGLTQKGGEIWEQFYKPNWKYYYYVLSDSEKFTGTIFGGSVEIVNVVFSELSNLDVIPQPKIINNKLTKILTPWNATYWKTLPEGHRIKYYYQEAKKKTISGNERYEKAMLKIKKVGEWCPKRHLR